MATFEFNLQQSTRHSLKLCYFVTLVLVCALVVFLYELTYLSSEQPSFLYFVS